MPERNVPGAHAVHPDAVAGVLDRRDLRELDDRRLRRAVRRGVRPRGEARDRRGEDDRPGPCARMTGTAARMPLTAPSTLTRNDRSQSSVDRLWMRPFGASTPALLTSTSSRPKRSTARSTTASTVGDLADVGRQGLDRAALLRQPVDGGVERRSLTSLSTTSVLGLARELARRARHRASRPRPVIATTRDARSFTRGTRRRHRARCR